MNYNIVELYVGFNKCHKEKYYNVPANDDAHVENYAKNLEFDTVDKYIFDGFFKDYPHLLTANRNIVYATLKNNTEIYDILDDAICRCWG